MGKTDQKKSQITTRKSAKNQDKFLNLSNTINDPREKHFLGNIHNELREIDYIQSESFNGILNILNQFRNEHCILIIIKNIKTFPHHVLNDLIHLISTYRKPPYSLKINLILGVQNNNIDEFHLRVKI